MATRIQLRRGTDDQWMAANPVLADGELVTETNTGKLKVGDGATAWSSLPYVLDGAGLVADQASQVVRSSKVTGDNVNRFERRADGSFAVGPGGDTPLRNSEGLAVIDSGAEPTRHALVIYTSSDETPTAQGLVIYDHLGAPIFTVPKAGGPAVYGDNFRVFAGGEVYNHEISLRLDGTLQARRGDPGGGVGVFALGAATTPPTRAPDGSGNLAGADTIAGNVQWVDATGRLHSRRASGPTDLVGANLPTGSYKPRVGEYLTQPWAFPNSAIAPTVSEMLLVPIDVQDWGMTFDRVGVHVTGAGVGGTPRARFGIYNDDGTGSAPTGAPVADWGQTGAQTTAATSSQVTISWTPPRLGRYWLATVYQPTGSVTTVPTWAMVSGPALPQTSLDPAIPLRALTQASVTGALPPIGTLTQSGAAYSVGLRRSV